MTQPKNLIPKGGKKDSQKIIERKNAVPKQQTEEEKKNIHFQNLVYAVTKFVGTKTEHIALDNALIYVAEKLGIKNQPNQEQK